MNTSQLPPVTHNHFNSSIDTVSRGIQNIKSITSIQYNKNIVTIYHTSGFDISELGIHFKLVEKGTGYVVIDVG